MKGIPHEEWVKLRNSPDIIAYHRRNRSRGQKVGWKEQHRLMAIAQEKAKKGIQHKVILAVAKGITTTTGIARHTGNTPRLVKAVLKDRSFDKNLTTYQKSVLQSCRDRMEEKAERAVEMLWKLGCKGTNAQRVQLDAIKDLLDRIGAKAAVQTVSVHRNYSPEESESMLKVAKEVEEIQQRLSAITIPYIVEKAKSQPEKVPVGPITTSVT